jgi:hypothetical protein
MKLSTLAVATLAVTALVGGAAFAQTDTGMSPPPAGPPVTMQPIPNPPEAAKAMPSKMGKHHKWRKHHMKAKKAAAEAAATPAPSK